MVMATMAMGKRSDQHASQQGDEEHLHRAQNNGRKLRLSILKGFCPYQKGAFRVSRHLVGVLVFGFEFNARAVTTLTACPLCCLKLIRYRGHGEKQQIGPQQETPAVPNHVNDINAVIKLAAVGLICAKFDHPFVAGVQQQQPG